MSLNAIDDKQYLESLSDTDLDKEIETRLAKWNTKSVLRFGYWRLVAEWERAVNVKEDRR